MRPPSTTRRALTGIVAIAALLAGCGGTDDDAADEVPAAVTTETTTPTETTTATETTTVAETTSVAAQATSATTEAPTTAAPVDTDLPTTEAPEPDTGECLVGDWVITEGQMDAYYAGVMSTLEAPLTIESAGSALLSFAADGTYEWAPEFALTVEVAGVTGTGEVVGAVTGNWTAVEGVVTTFSDLNAVVVSISVNGVVFEGPDLANGFLNSTPISGVTYSCDGSTPVLDFQTADPAVTVPVTLTPA